MQKLKYIFTKFDYFFYIMLFLVIFKIFLYLEIFNLNNISALLFSFVIIILIINKYYSDEINQFYKSSIIYDKINYNKYPNLNIDESIILIVLELKPLFKNNNFEYKNLLHSLDKFIETYKELKISKNGSNYDIMKDYSIKILNIVNSLGVNIDFSENNLENLKKIKNNLEIILSKYLTKSEILLNNDWLSDNVNYLSKPIYPDDLTGINNLEINFNK